MFSVLFPGQGSQSVGMGKQFYEKFDYIKSFKNNNLINQLISLTLITFSISFNLEIESSSTAFSISIKL